MRAESFCRLSPMRGKRGILFDFGNGRVDHFTWASVEHAMKERLFPDTISTDWGQAARADQVFNFANVLSKFLMLGMPLDRVIACATSNAANAFPAFKGLGMVRVGSPADLAIMEIQQGSFEFEDNYKGKRTGRSKLVTTGACSEGSAPKEGSMRNYIILAACAAAIAGSTLAAQTPAKKVPGDFDYLLGDWQFVADNKQYGKSNGDGAPSRPRPVRFSTNTA